MSLLRKYIKLISIRFPIIFILVPIAIYKYQFIGVGACAYPDESRYWHAMNGLYECTRGNLNLAFQYFFALEARPFLVLIHLPQYITQALFFMLFDVDPRSTESLFFAQLITLFYQLLNCYFFYKVLFVYRILDRSSALILTLLFSLSTENMIYLRHLLPYDIVLCCWFLIIYLHTKGISTLWFGILHCVLIFSYPAYWPMILISHTFRYFYKSTTTNCWKIIIRDQLKCSFFFLISVYSLQLIAILFHQNFLEDLNNASSTYLQFYISNHKNIYFQFMHYIYSISPILGLYELCVFCGVVLFQLFRVIKTAKINQFIILFSILVITLYVYDIPGNIYDTQMIYGRMFKQFTPFLLILIAIGVKEFSKYQLFKKLFIACTFIILLFHITDFKNNYYSLAYPRDVLGQFCKNTKNENGFDYNILLNDCKDKLIRIDEFENKTCFSIPPITSTSQSNSYSITPLNYTFVNVNVPDYKDPKWKQISLPINGQKIFEGPHFHSYIPYVWDWMLVENMPALQKNLRIKVYKDNIKIK